MWLFPIWSDTILYKKLISSLLKSILEQLKPEILLELLIIPGNSLDKNYILLRKE